MKRKESFHDLALEEKVEGLGYRFDLNQRKEMFPSMIKMSFYNPMNNQYEIVNLYRSNKIYLKESADGFLVEYVYPDLNQYGKAEK